MWFLKSDNGNLIYLKPNSTMTVGRNAGDIVLPNDTSISRSHATITVEPISNVTEIDDNTVPLSKCTVKDAGAKYGNFILKADAEPVRITAEGYLLQHLDRIRFGLQNYVYTAHYMPIITLTSGMNDAEKQQLTEIIDAIDGRMIYSWMPMCTHMTVGNLSVSEKFTCALAFGTPIVPVDYWKAALRAFENNEAFPEPTDFAASVNSRISSIGDVCVKPNAARRSIFKNLKFLHFNSRQFALYKRMIRIAGGTSIKAGREINDLDACNENVIVVQLVESNMTQATFTGEAGYAAVCEQLGRARRRTIPESEIALAILHCSTAQYCNPNYDYATLIRNRNPEIPVDKASILALDTQDVDLPSTSGPQQPTRSNVIVKETLDDDLSEPEIKASKPIIEDFISETSESSYSGESFGSIKIVSLNPEKYLEEEFRKPLGAAQNSVKREREDEDDEKQEEKIEKSTEKKIRLSVSGNEDSYVKPESCESNVWHELQERRGYSMQDEEEMDFVDEKIELVEKLPANQEEPRAKKEDSSVREKLGETSRQDVLAKPQCPIKNYKKEKLMPRTLDNWIVPESQEGEKTVGSSDAPPSGKSPEIIETSLKRKKSTPSPQEEKISKDPRPTTSEYKSELDLLTPKQEFIKTECDDGIWNRTDACKSEFANFCENDNDDGPTIYYQDSKDPESAPKLLLRVRIADDSDHSKGTKTVQFYHKRSVRIPDRIEIYDLPDIDPGIEKKIETSEQGESLVSF